MRRLVRLTDVMKARETRVTLPRVGSSIYTVRCGGVCVLGVRCVGDVWEVWRNSKHP